MSTPNDGGPAFATKRDYQHGGTGVEHVEGMSIRDWFAGMAMQGLSTQHELLLGNRELLEHFGTDGIDKLQASKAYRLADAMLAARKKNQT